MYYDGYQCFGGICCLCPQVRKVGHGERMECNIRTGQKSGQKAEMSQVYNTEHKTVKLKVPLYSLDRPLGFQAADAPRILDHLHMMVARLSALCTSRL
jgi:hypothetical protein